jgi:hypothetical protein
VLIEIDTLEVYAGEISKRALRLTLEWAKEHQNALTQLWNLCRSGQAIHKLPPLE